MALKRTIARALTSLAVLLVSAEVFGLAAFYVDTGGLFYTHPKVYDEPLPAPEDRLVLGEAVHPYFGFTHHPGTPFDVPESLRATPSEPGRLKTNNFGFVSPYPYPFAKTVEQQFVVGIFGGSVALWFCQVGAPRLVDNLKRHPFFREKEIVPLCFSHEGYKQPQEALVLAYFLSIGQSFDLVVNIDGFNDVALGALNNEHGLEFSMPSVQHLDPLIGIINQSALTPEKLDVLAAIFQDRRRLLQLVAKIQHNQFASVNFVLDRYHTVVNDRYVRALGRFNNLPSNPPDNAFVQVAKTAGARDRAGLFADVAGAWARASLLMNRMLADRGAAYFHFLQPNQYYTRRSFTPQEAAVALNEASPYKANAKDGYPALVRAAESTLTPASVRFFDATRVFDRETAPVYMDNCCHYTRAGNEVLADFIAASILATPGMWQ